MKTKRKKKHFITNFIILLSFFFILFYYWKSNTEEKSITPLPQELNETVKNKMNSLIEQVEEVGIRIIITEDYRSIEEQDRLYEQGRSTEGNIVTNAKGGESYHNYGLAIDFALLDINGNVIWDMNYDGNGNGKADWIEVVNTAKKLGFEWGGDWANFKDYPHLQIDFDLSIEELQRGERPPE
ncbi:M15 family metallopeptidase [Bacillus sp. B1-b2]|uniref:M15 family metallopeptidase n=1 Tax=Bacillus sp. B1-b2 TaxID=2653201 RepID=UPI001261BE65|nr:M15 family metallopeptidase [Bacillus sp. B1-b2]KAB7671293.1 M15 family metallopeptidase [Bacillus sp. B1-b2]